MKKIVIQIDKCKNCIFHHQHFIKHYCSYGAILTNADPVILSNPNYIPEDCPLMDATTMDDLPAPIYAHCEKGNMQFNIRL